MTESSSSSDWTGEVIRYLSRNIPETTYLPEPSRSCWSHDFLTAYQVACEALVKLGVADDQGAGALARENPVLPNPLPRWDDISAAVLYLAFKRDHLTSRPSGTTSTKPDLLVDEEVLPALRALGLVKDRGFLKASETILWRCGWTQGVDITRDPRFEKALAVACQTVPADIKVEIDRLVTISDADMTKALARGNAVLEKNRKMANQRVEDIAKRFPGDSVRLERARKSAKEANDQRITVDMARRSETHIRANYLDWLFFRRWRFSDGWLADDETKRALEIFHDDLAIKMRRAVVSRLYGDWAFAELGMQ